MKSLILPLAILLFAAACTKQDMPGPVDPAADPNTLKPASAMRMSGDTLRILGPNHPGARPGTYRPASTMRIDGDT